MTWADDTIRQGF